MRHAQLAEGRRCGTCATCSLLTAPSLSVVRLRFRSCFCLLAASKAEHLSSISDEHSETSRTRYVSHVVGVVCCQSCSFMFYAVTSRPPNLQKRWGHVATDRLGLAQSAAREARPPENFGRCAWANSLLSNELHSPAWRFARASRHGGASHEPLGTGALRARLRPPATWRLSGSW
jgi:hypothetical protein